MERVAILSMSVNCDAMYPSVDDLVSSGENASICRSLRVFVCDAFCWIMHVWFYRQYCPHYVGISYIHIYRAVPLSHIMSFSKYELAHSFANWRCGELFNIALELENSRSYSGILSHYRPTSFFFSLFLFLCPVIYTWRGFFNYCSSVMLCLWNSHHLGGRFVRWVIAGPIPSAIRIRSFLVWEGGYRG